MPLCFLLLEAGQFKCSELKSGHLLYDLEKLPLKRKTFVTLFIRAAEMFTLLGTDVTPYLDTRYAQYTMGQVRLKIIIFFIPFDVLLYQMPPKLHFMKTNLCQCYCSSIAF